MTKFSSEQIGATATLVHALGDSANAKIGAMLDRHFSGDWGDTCPEDSKANEYALKMGERILSIYHEDDFKVYVITEWDRSVTTVMLASDY